MTKLLTRWFKRTPEPDADAIDATIREADRVMAEHTQAVIRARRVGADARAVRERNHIAEMIRAALGGA